MLNDLSIFLILAVGMYDAWLILAGKETLSCRFQRYFPTWVDLVLLVVAIAVIAVLPIAAFLKLLLGVVAGHVLWPNRERYNG